MAGVVCIIFYVLGVVSLFGGYEDLGFHLMILGSTWLIVAHLVNLKNDIQTLKKDITKTITDGAVVTAYLNALTSKKLGKPQEDHVEFAEEKKSK